MATTYTATVNIAFRKQHTCASCNTKYSYEIRREIKGTGNTEEKAQVAADKAAMDTIQNEVEVNPCPTCGLVQPDMVAKVRKSWFWGSIVCSLIGVSVAWFLATISITHISTSTYVCLGSVLLGIGLKAAGVFYNPNRDTQANLHLVGQKVNDGKVSVDERPAMNVGPAQDPFGGIGAGQLIGLVICSAALLTAGAPEMLRILGGWTSNSSCYPSVAGPGDTATFYFNEQLSSVKGMWNGSSSVRAVDAGPNGVAANFTARTKNSSWGNTISGKSVSNSNNAMWAEVTFPDDPNLAGKTFKLEITNNVSFPYRQGNGFDNSSRTFTHSTEVTLSSSGAGSTYKLAWWGGQLTSAIALMIGAAVLSVAARNLRAKALPAGVAVIT